MQNEPSPMVQSSPFEEIVLESIIRNRALPLDLKWKACDALAERQEARMPWLTHPNECTCDDCAAWDAAHAA